MIEIVIQAVETSDPAFLTLCAALDGYLNELAGGEERRMQYIPHNQAGDLSIAFLARENGTAIGCAGLKELDAITGEIKRVYVVPLARRKGVGNMLMNELEKEAVRRGYQKLLLESGAPLKEAMRMYRRYGYMEIPPYEPYAKMESSSDSICMEKNL